MRVISVHKSFVRDLSRLKRDSRKVYKSATEILFELQVGEKPSAPLRREGRIPNCQKYELQDGYRLVLQRSAAGDSLIALAVGKHDHVDAFLNGHRDKRFDPSSCNPLSFDESRESPANSNRMAAGRDSLAGAVEEALETTNAPAVAARHYFADLTDDEFAATGLTADLIEGLRSPFHGSDSPELLDFLDIIWKRGHVPLANALLDHVVKPTDSTLTAIRSLAASSSQAVPDATTAAHKDTPGAAPSVSKPRRIRKRVTKRSKAGALGRGRRTRLSAAEAGLKRKRTPVQERQKKASKAATSRVKMGKVTKRKVTNMTLQTRPKARVGGRVRHSRLQPGLAAREMPSIPRVLSVSSLMRYLDGEGFRTVDNRNLGGGLWVLAQEHRFAKVAATLAARGVRCKFFPPGTRRKEQRASWLIDAFNRLA